MAGTVISAAVRNNLAALQNTSAQQALVQNRLATGKKVNSALDNPSNFFTAQSLNRRAGDLNSLLDGMSNGIKTLDAASNATTSISKSIESLKANIRSARSDKSFQGQSFAIDNATVTGTGVTSNATAKLVQFDGGSVGTTAVKADLSTAQGTLTGSAYSAMAFDDATDKLDFKLALNGSTSTTQVTVQKGTTSGLKITVGSAPAMDNVAGTAAGVTADEMATGLNAALAAANVGISVANSSGKLVFTGTAGDASKAAVTMSAVTAADGATSGSTLVSLTNFGFTAAGAGSATGITGVTAKSVDNLVSDLNANTSLAGKLRASNDGGKLRIENLSASDTDLKVTGVGTNGLDGSTGTKSIGGNENRKALVKQFNELRQQIDKTAEDASFNGINLLKADKLKLTFNETGTSSIEVQAKDSKGNVRGVSTGAGSLAIGEATNDEFSDDTKLDARLDGLSKSLTTLQTQSSDFGSALTTIQTRQDFTKSMINTLQSGADALVNADLSEESATLLALNTRQQLSQTALQLASQADQAVLRLF